MSDFERRLREALDSAGSEGPDPHGFADDARRRLRGRRRVRAVGAGLGVALAVALVPIGLTVLGDGDRGGDAPGVVASGDSGPIPSDWTWQSWRDFEIAVPADWVNGAASQWCVGSRPPGIVDRGEGVSTMVACTPSLSSSVSFRAGTPEQPLPEHQGWAEQLTYDGYYVDVVAKSPEMLKTMVDSARRFEAQDSRGCVPGVYANTDFSLDPDPGGDLTVCRYAANQNRAAEPGYWLAESVTLGDDESEAVREAIADAPSGKGRFLRCEGEAEFYLLVTDDGVPAWVYNGECGQHEVLTTTSGDDVEYHQVTDRLLRLLGSPVGNLRQP